MTVTNSDEPSDASEQDESRTVGPKPSPSPRHRPQPTPRSTTTDVARSERNGVDRGRTPRIGLRPRGLRAQSLVPVALVVAFVLLASAATWFALEANALREGSPEENSAMVDENATAEVREQIGSAVESVFSYNYTSLDRTRRAAERVLLDKALNKYNAELDEASKEAKERKLVRTASVRALGVRTLHDDTARVLVFLDQQTLETGSGQQDAKTVYLQVTAKKVSGSWKIATMSGL